MIDSKQKYTAFIKAEAKRLGFLSCGISKAGFLEDEAPRLEKWLNENRKIDHVLAKLKQANFDPEFYTRYEKDIFKSFKENLQKA